MVQANSSFFLQRGTRSLAMRLLRQGQIHMIGSDCHNVTDRPPDMARAICEIRRCCGEAVLRKLQNLEDVVFAVE